MTGGQAPAPARTAITIAWRNGVDRDGRERNYAEKTPREILFAGDIVAANDERAARSQYRDDRVYARRRLRAGIHSGERPVEAPETHLRRGNTRLAIQTAPVTRHGQRARLI